MSTQPDTLFTSMAGHEEGLHLSPRFGCALDELTNSYQRKCAELAVCTKRIAELESEVKEFKPLKIIQNFENRLKEKQNIIEVLEKRIAFLQKKALCGPNTWSKQGCSHSQDAQTSSDSILTELVESFHSGSKSEGAICCSPKSSDRVSVPTQDQMLSSDQTTVTQIVHSSPSINNTKETKEAESKHPVSAPNVREGSSLVNLAEIVEAKPKGRKKGVAPKKQTDFSASESSFVIPSEAPAKRGRKRKSNPLTPISPSLCSDSDTSSAHQEKSFCANVDLKDSVPAVDRSSTDFIDDPKIIVDDPITFVNEQKQNDNKEETNSKDSCSKLLLDQSSKAEEKEKSLLFDGAIKNRDPEEHTTFSCTEFCKSAIPNSTYNTIFHEKVPSLQSCLGPKEHTFTEVEAEKSPATNENKAEIGAANSKLVFEPVPEEKALTKIPDAKAPTQTKTPLVSSNRFTIGEKIDPEMFRVISLKTVSGKILEYYLSKADDNVYKKVSDGIIGKKMGHITEFGKLDTHGHLVLNP